MYYILAVRDDGLLDIKTRTDEIHDKDMDNVVHIDEMPFIVKDDYMEFLRSIAADFKPQHFSTNLTNELIQHCLYVDKYRLLDIILERDGSVSPVRMHGIVFIFDHTVFGLNLNITNEDYIIPVDEELKVYYNNSKESVSKSNQCFPEGLITQCIDRWLGFSSFTIKRICDDITLDKIERR